MSNILKSISMMLSGKSLPFRQILAAFFNSSWPNVLYICSSRLQKNVGSRDIPQAEKKLTGVMCDVLAKLGTFTK